MTYSVWNPRTEKYDYYEAGMKNILPFPVPGHLRHAWTSKIGTTADEASWPLPSGARHVGSGPYARGMIAQGSDNSVLAGLASDAGKISPHWIWLGVGALFWLVVRR